MALTYSVVRQFTRQSKTGVGTTGYGTVPGMTISSGFFEAGKKYLLLASAVLDGTNVNAVIRAALAHGSTLFSETEFIDEPDATTARFAYGAWTVWTAVGGEDVTMRYSQALSAETVGITHCVMIALKLSDDFVEGTDWYFSQDNTSTTLGTGDSSSNNANVGFTPPAPGNDYLVLSSAKHQEVSLTISYQSKLVSTGTFASSLPRRIEEGEDGGLEGRKIMAMARVYKALGAVAQTFTEVSSLSAAGAGTEARLSSQVFAINWSLFKNAAAAYTEGGVDLSGTDFNTTVQTVSLTPSALIDTLVIGFWAWDGNTQGLSCKARLQADNSDITAGQTTDALLIAHGHDNRDEVGVFQVDIVNLSAAAHTIDHDGSAETAAAGRAATARSLLAAPLELATSSSGRPMLDLLASPLGFGFGD